MAFITTQLSLDLHVSSNFFIIWQLAISKKPKILPGKYILIKGMLNLSKLFSVFSLHKSPSKMNQTIDQWPLPMEYRIVSTNHQVNGSFYFMVTLCNVTFMACLAFDKCWFDNPFKWSKRISCLCHIFCVLSL